MGNLCLEVYTRGHISQGAYNRGAYIRGFYLGLMSGGLEVHTDNF